VERIDLIRGGAPGIEMQGQPVLVNVVRRDTSGFEGATTLSGSSIYDGRVFSNVRTEGRWLWPGGRSAEFSVFYGYLPDDYWGDGRRIRYNPDRSVQVFSNFESDAKIFRKFVTGAFEMPLAGGKLRINGAYQPFIQDFEVTDRLIIPGAVEFQHDTYTYDQNELGLRYSRGLTPRLSTELIGFQQWKTQAANSNFRGLVQRRFFLDKEVAETVGRLQVQFRQSPAVTWEAGGEMALNTLDARTSLLTNGVNIALPAANVMVEEKRSELYATLNWRINPRLRLEAGVRQERTHLTSEGDLLLDKTLQFTKPRAQLTWSPTSKDQFRVRAERSVGQLNFDDFVAQPTVANSGVVLGGNPDIDPLTAWVYEATYEHRFGPGAAATLTYRHFAYENVVDRVPLFLNGVPVADGPGNIGEGVKDEVILAASSPLERWGIPNAQLRGQLAWRRSDVVDPLDNRSREISAVRPVEWDLHFVQDLPRWKATWGIDVNKGAADNAGFRERFFRLSEVETRNWDPWVNLFGEYKPRPDLLVRLEFLNLTERSFERIRSVYAGARDRTPLLFTEVRDLRWGRVIVLRLRKTY